MFSYFLLGFIAIIINGSSGKENVFTYLTAKVMEEEIGIDWWNILNADATCCPGNTDEASCNAESGSSCVWFPKPNNAIALAAGGPCVGESFVKCKRRGGINACCTPACNPNGPASPAPPGQTGPGQTPPVCGPAVVTPQPTPTPTPKPTPNPTPNPTARPTPQPTPHPSPNPTPNPTPQPTVEECLIDVNYAFEGYPCQASGDPHTKKVQDGKHDFQGQPTLSNQNGQLLNQFFYVAPCNGYTSADMPISVLATHYHWGTRPVSGIDYFTIILTKDDGDEIYVYASSELHSYSTDAAATTNYDDTTQNGATTITPLVSNTAVSMGGGKFVVTYKNIDSKSSSFTIKIDNDDAKVIYIYMKGQMNRETDIWYNTGTTRYRMHYVYMTQSSKYKCMACGLCGDYSGDASSTELVLCDGTVETVRTGWNGDHTPEAYDLFGLTYEYNYYTNVCTYNYNIRENTKDLNYEDPCDTNIAAAVEAACAQKRQDNIQCCNTIIGGTVCQDLEDDCDFDACVVATDMIIAGATQADAIEEAVTSLFADTINGACTIDGIGDAVDTRNVLLGDYLGCYVDNTQRRFDWPENGVRSLTGDLYHNTAECVKLCVDNGYNYMGLQYDVECFCGNDLAKIQGLGERDPAEGQCGMNQQGTDQYDAFGCWGGGWTNCVYDISANYNNGGAKRHAHDNNILMVESNSLLSSSYNNNMQIGIIGGVILIGAVSLIYKRYYDKNIKDSKYIPINDDNKV